MSHRYAADGVLIGAGTVLDAETARICILAGAQFIISPSLNPETIACCRRYSIPVMPGALTPTEIVTAWTAGADCVKVFPAGALGGASYIKSLKAPLPHTRDGAHRRRQFTDRCRFYQSRLDGAWRRRGFSRHKGTSRRRRAYRDGTRAAVS
ncbi:MAG: hypothetical protein WKF84_28295 [Pyrinomonadaceae bacterium]